MVEGQGKEETFYPISLYNFTLVPNDVLPILIEKNEIKRTSYIMRILVNAKEKPV